MGEERRPSGTVTSLFTDIEDSSGLWERQPDRMASALARHDEILRRVLVQHRGHINPASAVEHGRATVEVARAAKITWMVDTVSNNITAALSRAGEAMEALDTMRSVLVHAAAGGGVQSLANTVPNAIVLFTRLGRSDAAAVSSGWLDAETSVAGD